jgi:RNA polymerase sigma factor (sigma-70 family)
MEVGRRPEGEEHAMATSGQHAAVLEGVRRIFGGGTVAGLGADSLLRRFATRRDEAAFEAIVARHGPMVLGVCRRVLDDRHDVEDAFQATFLVFVKKAGSIRDGEGLGPWLYGVARRVSTRARANASKRRATERSGIEVDPACPSVDPDRDEIRAVVDEEIGHLPDHYRKALVQCDLEGITQGEAAQRLGWTEGTVRGRLAKARGLLRSRLARRGLVAPAAVFAGLFVPDTASAARLGEKLSRAVLKTMVKGGSVGVEEVSTSAVALAREVLQVMIRQKIKTTAVAMLVAGVVVSGTGVAVVRAQRAVGGPSGTVQNAVKVPAKARSRRPPDPLPWAPGEDQRPRMPGVDPLPQSKGRPPVVDKPAEKPEPEPADARRIAIGDRLIIEVLEALPGREIHGERLVRPDGTVSLGFYGDLKVAGLTRREAKVEIIEHLRECLTDQTLGLITYEEQENRYVRVHPARSDRVYVDDTPTFDTRRSGTTGASPESPRTQLPRSPARPGNKADLPPQLQRSPFDPGTGADLRPQLPRSPFEPGTGADLPTRSPSKPGTGADLQGSQTKPEPNKPEDPTAFPRDQTQKATREPAASPTTIQPGDRLVIEVLQGRTGREIHGERAVRPDGTVSLGFYGDLKIAGLTRTEAKVKVIEHLRQYLTDASLGLVETKEDGTVTKIPAERSTFAYVDVLEDSPPRAAGEARIDALEQKLDRILQELEAIKRGR